MHNYSCCKKKKKKKIKIKNVCLVSMIKNSDKKAFYSKNSFYVFTQGYSKHN
jgi:hypothetical protein